MRRRSAKPYLLLAATLLLLLSLPKENADQARSMALAVLAPPLSLFHGFVKDPQEEIKALQLENHLLTTEVVRLQHLLQHEELLLENCKEKILSSLHQSDLTKHLELQLISIPAQVILRSSATWDNALWINVGKAANERFQRTVVEKNSPVLSGNTLIGVIDYVSEKRARVKLIGDPGLNPSVRAVRLLENKPYFLAKGELQGKGLPSMRSIQPNLVGTGFNYDFADEEGPARDLRTGEPVGGEGAALPIVDVGDLLVTTGMDGVFPKGFEVGRVTRIVPLKEGDFYFDLEAVSTAEDLDFLSMVYILPPM